MSDEKPETLRDHLSAAFEEHVPAEAPKDPGQVVEGTIPGPETVEKPGRTAGRQRDEKGKLLPGKPENKGFVKQEPEGAVAAAPQPAVTRPPRPSSWKKDYWDHWDKIDPKLAEYLHQRENEFAKGVSTYKQEWDQVRPIAEAMAQFQPLLQQHNIKPEQWISNLGNAHKILATGQPEQKLSAAMKLFQDYKIPIEQLFVQGQDGKIYFNPQVQNYQAQAPQPDFEKLIDQKLLEKETFREIQDFAAATDDKGSLKHPHFDALKQTIHGLLQADLAKDLTDAYNIALKHPRHADLYAQLQEQEQRAELERKAAEQAKVVARARTNAVSVKGSTPSTPTAGKPKDRREALEAAWDQHADGGRL